MTPAADKLRFLLALQDQLGGSIPFDRWMQEALYHRRFGYYASHIRGIGPRGDFSTWPLRNRNLAEAIAAWALSQRPAGSWHLIEIGAGTGALAADVLKSIGWWKRPQLHIVEVSEPLRSEQMKRLGRRAIWHASMTEALSACGGSALIYSNELVDAFPARVFQKTGDSWSELALRIENGRVTETWHPVEEGHLPASTVFESTWADGQRVEVQQSYRSWQSQWDPGWKAGAQLIVDYGDTSPALYHRRPQGSLRAFAHHQRLEGAAAYDGFGVRDLTVDVNFSDLMVWCGRSKTQLQSLDEFLTRQLPKAASVSLPDFPEAGEAFKVLLQSR